MPPSCIMQMLHRLQKIYNVYQKCEFNVMTVLVYPIWFCTCIPGICCWQNSLHPEKCHELSN